MDEDGVYKITAQQGESPDYQHFVEVKVYNGKTIETLSTGSKLKTGLQFDIVSAQQFGNLNVITSSKTNPSSEQEVTYTPTSFTDSDSFTFTVTRNDLTHSIASLPATVDIILSNPPTANDVKSSTTINTPTEITLSGNDPENDSITLIRTSNVKHGILSELVQKENNAFLTYTPNQGFEGTDSFTYVSVNLVGQKSPLATVSILVEPIQLDNFKDSKVTIKEEK